MMAEWNGCFANQPGFLVVAYWTVKDCMLCRISLIEREFH